MSNTGCAFVVTLAFFTIIMVPTTSHAQDLDPLLSELATSPKNPANLESGLADLYDAALVGNDVSILAAGIDLSGQDNQMVQVVIEMISADAPLPSNLGIHVETTYENLVQATVPVLNLEAIASDENVKFVRTPFKPVPAFNPVVSMPPLEGPAAVDINTGDTTTIITDASTDNSNMTYLLLIPIVILPTMVILFMVRKKAIARQHVT